MKSMLSKIYSLMLKNVGLVPDTARHGKYLHIDKFSLLILYCIFPILFEISTKILINSNVHIFVLFLFGYIRLLLSQGHIMSMTFCCPYYSFGGTVASEYKWYKTSILYQQYSSSLSKNCPYNTSGYQLYQIIQMASNWAYHSNGMFPVSYSKIFSKILAYWRNVIFQIQIQI